MPTALFFGKAGCSYSERALAHIKLLGFETTEVLSRSRKEKLADEVLWWRGDYIFCFRSYYILPGSLLRQAEIAAINFHPGSTEYPGSGCVNYALYDNAKRYGATAHIMTEAIDAGPIVDERRFSVFPSDTVTTLLARAHHKTFDLILDVTSGIAANGPRYVKECVKENAHKEWSPGGDRRMSEIDKLQRIDANASREEMERVIRATNAPGFPPFIELHGRKFVLKE